MRIFKFFLALIVLAGMLAGYALKIEPYRLVTEELELVSPYVDEGTKVAILTDIHLKEDFDEAQLEKAVKKVNEHNPEAVLFLGDLYDNYELWQGDEEKIKDIFRSLNADIKLCVYGNHDYGGKAQWAYKEIMEESGFTILKNKDFPTDFGITFYGADDYIFGEKGEGFKFDGNSYGFAMAHVPASVETISNSDFFAAGHTHGGQVRLPFIKPFWTPKGTLEYYGGMYDNPDGGKIYVSRGVGTSIMTVRFNAVPEITICKFSKKTVEN
ncbi:MAG: metallophosphoesterase [Clostridia bacterium]|nr:metallophosphoesterase [Clostridia bacterium]